MYYFSPRRHKRGGGRQANGNSSDARYSNGRFEDTSHKAWGSQMVFNNHHTPPASSAQEDAVQRHVQADPYERYNCFHSHHRIFKNFIILLKSYIRFTS